MSDDSLWFRPPPRPSRPPVAPARIEPVLLMSSSTARRRVCQPRGRSSKRAAPWESTRPRSATWKTSRRSTSAVSAWSSSRAHERWSRLALDMSNPAWTSRPTRPGCGFRARWCSNSWAHRWICRPLHKHRPTRRSMAPAPSATAHRNHRRERRSATPARRAITTPPMGRVAETVAQPVKIDNDLYVRDYAKCILCYKCVEACGTDAQNTFAIAVAGRGFDARISTEGNVPLPESACVYCGNCIGVCPTGALMFRSEYELRKLGKWDESRQTQTDTICPYCGVGCTLSLHVQDNQNREGNFTPRCRGHARPPLHQGTVRLRVCTRGRFAG